MKIKITFLLMGIILCLNAIVSAQSNNSSWQIKWEPSKSFIENKGQFHLYQSNEKVLFAYDNGSTMIYFTKKGVRYSFLKRWSETDKAEKEMNESAMKPSAEEWEEREEEKNKMDYETDVAGFDWLNDGSDVQVVGIEETNDFHSYPIKQKDGSTQSINLIKGYKKIIYKNIYQGIDVEFEFHPVDGIQYSVRLHPGADISKFKMLYSKNINIDNEGNIQIPTKFGAITEHAPFSFYAANRDKVIRSGFVQENNIISFNIEGYDNSLEVIIDPWVQTPTLANSNGVWECERDAAGNVYIIGGDMPMKLQKYNPTGALQWTYNTPWDTANYWLGTLATDLNGNSYITAGSIANLKKINTTNNVVWSYSAPVGSCNEYWDITFNCDQTKLVIGGTTGTMTLLDGAIFDINTSNGAINSSIIVGWGNMFGMPASINECRSITLSSNAKYYFLTLDTIGCVGENFSSISPQIFFRANSTYNLGYRCENYRPNNGNSGIKAIKANGDFVYTQNGTQIHKRSLTDGSILDSAAIPGGLSTTTMGFNQVGNSGIDIDTCGNVYVGSGDRICKFDANLNLITSVNTSYKVSDVAVSTGGNVIICGTTGNENSMNRTGYVQSINMSACNPMPLYCCDANINPVGPFCADDGPATLVPDQIGGIWSGIGVNPVTGVFSPDIAGEGSHSITYTLPCGSSSIIIVVDTCLKACKNINGNIFVSGGIAPYTWQEWGPADTTPITNQAECTACGYTWNALYSECLNGIFPVTSCHTTHWSDFATGDSLISPVQLPVRVVDINGHMKVIDSLTVLPSCLPCDMLSLSISDITSAGCMGSNNGSFLASVSGGASPYSLKLTKNGTLILSYINGIGSQTFIGLAAGNYILTVLDNDSCMKSIAVTIVENPLPSPAGNISGPSVVNQGQTGVSYSVLPISNATNYVWTFPQSVSIVSGNNTNSIIVNFSTSSTSGIITVYGNDSCGYGASSPVFPVTIITGIEQVQTFTINLYPNPTNGKVTLEMSNYPNEPLTMKVYNILGEMIFNALLGNERKQSFDFKTFTNGLYYVKISGNKINKIEKLIIQKID